MGLFIDASIRLHAHAFHVAALTPSADQLVEGIEARAVRLAQEPAAFLFTLVVVVPRCALELELRVVDGSLAHRLDPLVLGLLRALDGGSAATEALRDDVRDVVALLIEGRGDARVQAALRELDEELIG